MEDSSHDVKSRVQKQFGQSAGAYASSDVHARGESLDLLRQWISPQPDWRALDVATGAGHTAVLFAPQVGEMIACDLTDEMLEETARRVKFLGLKNVSMCHADAESLPLDDSHFDLVSCRLAFHHFPHPERAASEFARVLKPNGMLAFTDNVTVDDDAAAEFYNRFETIRDPSHCWVMSTEQLMACLEKPGFQIVKSLRLSKEFEFHGWADRQHVTDSDKKKLLDMMANLPNALRPFFKPRWADDTAYFSLWEQVLVATKRPIGEHLTGRRV